MILRTVLVATAAVLLAVPATAGDDDLPIGERDPGGDVTIFDGGGTKPTTGQRNSIDLTRFTVARQGDEVRFTFRIARITGSRTFDQIVGVQLRRAGGGEGVLFDMTANPQHRTGTAFLGTSTVCPVAVTTSKRTGTVRVDVIEACVPDRVGVLRALTYTQAKNGSGPGFSEDTLRVPGRVALR